jgi:hypothetical protein
MGKGTFPGFKANPEKPFIAVAEGLRIDPRNLAGLVWVDGDADRVIAGSHRDDGRDTGLGRVVVDGKERTLRDEGVFPGSTMVVNGAARTVAMAVWVFTDGTYMVRIKDADLPPGTHSSAVDALQLGRWNGIADGSSFAGAGDDCVICFAAGTLIHTRQGLVLVERLVPGDRVMTADHGFCPIRWVGRRSMPGMGAMAPVLITEGALGNSRALRVSPQHRMLIAGWRAEVLFGQSEVLVPAIALVNDSTIRRDPCPEVTYVHFLCDRHQIVFAEGIPTESLNPGQIGLSRLDRAARDEVLALFPALARDPLAYGPPARQMATVQTGALLG